jgi:osmoprotectant transport system ATP-binding protein
MSAPPAVELRSVAKVYPGGIRAVDGLSLVVPAGRVIALLGASGCGKTTTLRLINRLEETTSGQILVRGQDVRRQRPELLRRSIGYVIQEGGLFSHWNVAENVATVPRLLGWDARRAQGRVAEVLEMVGLPAGHFGRRMPAELSGGQRQRVGVARALAADPDLLLMDEPFGALDPGTREAIQDEFLRLQDQLHKTVVVVTHDMAEAGKLADEIVLMAQGRVLQQGRFGDFLLQPAGPQVRAFLGRQGPALALDALRLSDVVQGLVPREAGPETIRLKADTDLGQVLAALANARPGAAVQLNGDDQRVYSAADVQARTLANLAKVRPAEANS